MSVGEPRPDLNNTQETIFRYKPKWLKIYTTYSAELMLPCKRSKITAKFKTLIEQSKYLQVRLYFLLYCQLFLLQLDLILIQAPFDAPPENQLKNKDTSVITGHDCKQICINYGFYLC
jgi:hypothetical protein